jgi:transposase-like protein
MLNKKSGLSYNDVRDRYEHFRARCTKNTEHLVKVDKAINKLKENGCTEPIHGYKSKCILHIVPQETEGDTFQIDNKCIKHMK